MTFASAPDYENKSSYAAELSVSDGENNRSVVIVVTINDVNDNAPVFKVTHSLPMKTKQALVL